MFADPEKTRLRRIKRRLKAAASIVVAMAAGTFLACRREGGEAPERKPSPAATPAGTARPEPAVEPTSEPAASASASASASAAPSAAPTVDKEQHKKGMPVPDNLLE